MRVLYIQASWVPPPVNPQADRFLLLSEKLEGDVLQPIWFTTPEQLEAKIEIGTRSGLTRGRFRFHWFCCFRPDGRRRRLGTLWFYLRKGLQLHREKPFDCIVVYSHMSPALVALILKWFTRTRLVVEIMTSPDLSYLYEHRQRTLGDRLMRIYSDLSLHLTVALSDRVHLLYPTQLQHYRLLRRFPSSVFHDFVPISLIPAANAEPERVILFVGAPWYLKGVDLLIAAFRRIAGEFPDVILQVQGYFDDEAGLRALVADDPRIEILKAVPNPETLIRISKALLLVQPSRCEGLSRVLIEAMSAGVPAIASDAGGNPHCVRDGETGIVFPSGDVEALSRALRELLSDSELRGRLGRRAYEVAHAELSEQVYAEQFTRMVEAAVHRRE